MDTMDFFNQNDEVLRDLERLERNKQKVSEPTKPVTTTHQAKTEQPNVAQGNPSASKPVTNAPTSKPTTTQVKEKPTIADMMGFPDGSNITEDGEITTNNSPSNTPVTNVVPVSSDEPTVIVTEEQKQSLMKRIGDRYGVEPDKLFDALKKTCFKQYGNNEVTNEQMLSLLVVAEQYDLNPFINEIYAFPKGNGIVPMIGIDGWVKIINAHPKYKGMEFEYSDNMINNLPNMVKSCNEWIDCKIHRSDLDVPIVVREYLDEAYVEPRLSRDRKIIDGPWQSHPKRMLRHKAIIQAARVAFGFRAFGDPSDLMTDSNNHNDQNVIDIGNMEYVQSEHYTPSKEVQHYLSLAINRVAQVGVEPLMNFIKTRIKDANDLLYIKSKLEEKAFLLIGENKEADTTELLEA